MKMNHSDWKSIFTTASLPFGIYTFWMYGSVFTRLCKYIAICALFVTGVYFVALFGRRIKSSSTRKRKRIIKSRFRKACIALKNILSVAGCFFMLYVFIQMNMVGGITAKGGIFTTDKEETGVEEYDAGVEEDAQKSAEEFYTKHIDDFQNLKENKWQNLNLQEKVAVLQVVADYQGIQLGYGTTTVYASQMNNIQGKKIRGYYDPSNNDIHINLALLKNEDSEEILKTLLHECFHVSQRQIVDIYKNLNQKDQNSYFFRNTAAVYAKELENYNSGLNETGDFDEYESQKLEEDARLYASFESFRILTLLDEKEKD